MTHFPEIGMAGFDNTLDAVSHAMSEPESDPVGAAVRGVFASLDELIALATDPTTRDQVCAERIALGQMLTRCQVLLSFAMATQPNKFKVISNG